MISPKFFYFNIYNNFPFILISSSSRRVQSLLFLQLQSVLIPLISPFSKFYQFLIIYFKIPISFHTHYHVHSLFLITTNSICLYIFFCHSSPFIYITYIVSCLHQCFINCHNFHSPLCYSSCKGVPRLWPSSPSFSSSSVSDSSLLSVSSDKITGSLCLSSLSSPLDISTASLNSASPGILI